MTRDPLGRLRPFAGLILAALGSVSTGACGTETMGSRAEADATVRPLDLLVAIEDERAVSAGDFAEQARPTDPGDPVWPTETYLLAEVLLSRGELEEARVHFGRLADWSASDPLGDGWGGSGLAAVAYWRWLRLLETGDDAVQPEIRRALELADRLLGARLPRGMFGTSILASMPQVREDVSRRLARLAWSIGDADSALDHFLDYLRIARSAELTDSERELLGALVERGRISAPRLALFRARRLLALGMSEQAGELGRSALASDSAQDRAEARLLLATVEQRLNAKSVASERGPVHDLLSAAYREATDPATREEALYERARLLARGGPGRDLAGQARDLDRLRREFPAGRFVDDTLLDLARRARSEGAVDRALALYAELRALEGENDYLHTATFQIAMIHLTRGAPGDATAATRVLTDLAEREPDGPYRLIATFWLARIAEERGDAERAAALFRELVETAPYEYQALRARMHLSTGAAARARVDTDAGTCRALRSEFESSQVEARIGGTSVYHRRLAQALDSGLYRAGLDAEIALHTERRPPTRLESLSADELAELPSLPRLALLLALRQDALAARDLPPAGAESAANRLRIAAAVKGRDSSLDTPLALRLVFAAGEPRYLRWAAQRDSRYLAAAYPRVFLDEIAAEAGAHDLPPELMYAIARRESLFFPAALSPAAALGLFQLVFPTFAGLDEKHGLLQPGATWQEHLLDPRRSTRAVALLFAETFVRQRRLSARLGGPPAVELYSIMEHNAGYGNVRAWREELAEIHPTDDLEFVIDNIRAAETRVFTRNVLSDMIVARAAGIFGATCGADPPSPG